MITKYEKYVQPKLQLVKRWVLEERSESEIAQRLGIGYQTLKKYKEEHKAFGEILELGREGVIAEVEDALMKKAKGYTYTETKTVEKEDRTETTTTEKEMPPDLSAISFLLRNFCPEKWSDKPNVQKEEAVGGGVVILPEIMEEEETAEGAAENADGAV